MTVEKEKLVADFELEDLKKLIYWVILKFREDEFHHQGVSAKSDLIGGFFDRWFNRAPEFLIFSRLLKDKPYDVVIDNYLYGQDTKKNAPDILGLKSKKDGKVLSVFARFVDGNWEHAEGTPFVEVKTNRKTQSLIAVGETQMDKDHYYVLVESNVPDDYLTVLFEKQLFDKKIFEGLQMPEGFIKSDSKNMVIFPKPAEPAKNLGFFKLMGIFTGDEIKKYSIYAKGQNDKKEADKPWYFGRCEEAGSVALKVREKVKEGIWKYGESYVPFFIEFKGTKSKATVVKKSKSTVYIEVEGEVKINDYVAKTGYHKINFKKFDRKSKKNEYIGDKNVFAHIADDSTKDLIKKFDQLVGL